MSVHQDPKEPWSRGEWGEWGGVEEGGAATRAKRSGGGVGGGGGGGVGGGGFHWVFTPQLCSGVCFNQS